MGLLRKPNSCLEPCQDGAEPLLATMGRRWEPDGPKEWRYMGENDLHWTHRCRLPCDGLLGRRCGAHWHEAGPQRSEAEVRGHKPWLCSGRLLPSQPQLLLSSTAIVMGSLRAHGSIGPKHQWFQPCPAPAPALSSGESQPTLDCSALSNTMPSTPINFSILKRTLWQY